MFVRSGRVEFAGAGSGRKGNPHVTRLNGPSPSPVTEAEGNLILPAQNVTGCFNALGADVTIRDLVVTGCDAAVVARDRDRATSAIRIQDVVLAGAGRGVLVLGSGDVAVVDTEIHDTAWHGISAKAAAAGLAALKVAETKVLNALCAGFYVENTTTVLDNVTVVGALCGGVVAFRSQLLLFDSLLLSNRSAGILLVEAGGLIRDNDVLFSAPTLLTQIGGDGVSVFSSPDVFVDENLIHGSARAGVGVYGSTVSLADNTITCSAFDIDVEQFGGVAGDADDVGGNTCGCGGPLGDCEAVSASPASIPSQLQP